MYYLGYLKKSLTSNHIFFIFFPSFLTDTIKGETQPKYLMRFFKIIPIVLVLGLSLVLWRCWKISQWVDEPVFVIMLEICL